MNTMVDIKIYYIYTVQRTHIQSRLPANAKQIFYYVEEAKKQKRKRPIQWKRQKPHLRMN